MTDLFLGIIAAAVLVMAIIQVAAIVLAARATKRVGDAVTRLEQDVKPIVTNLQTISAEAARVTSAAAAQVQRAEQMVQGIVAALAAFRSAGSETAGKRPAAADEDDALFIG